MIIEFMAMPDWQQWLQQIGAFTSSAFQNYDNIVNSVAYLLLFWNKVSSELPYLARGDTVPQFVHDFLPSLACAFMTARLDRAGQAAASAELDELFDPVQLSEQLRHLPI